MLEQRDRPLLLIADDDPEGLRFLYDLLVAAEFEVIVADDGERAIEAASGGERPELILLDMLMPGIDGIETCRRLKADPTTKDIPVMFMTAHDSAGYRIQTFQVGGVDYISKPFEAAELLARVRTQLSVQRLTNALREQNARLQDEIRERAAAEVEREQLTRELLKRTEELGLAKERLEQELVERERAEEARATLQAKVIAAQEERLLELSTPLIPITNRIVVMPFIGMMDESRAQQAMSIALQGVSTRKAAIVIIDITGVRAVDASVASMIVQTSNGLRLLGATTLVTGIGPDVARQLVALEGVMGSLVTKATLQDGIAHALKAARKRGSSRR